MTNRNSNSEEQQREKPSAIHNIIHSPKFLNPSAVAVGGLGVLAFRFDHATSPIIGIGCFGFSIFLLYWAEAQRLEEERKAEEKRKREVSEAKRENEELTKLKKTEILEIYIDKEIASYTKKGQWGLVMKTISDISNDDKYHIVKSAYRRVKTSEHDKPYSDTINPFSSNPHSS